MVFKATHNWQEELPNILAMGRQGQTMAQIARQYGVSRQRMKQIVARHFPNWNQECSYAARQAEKDRLFQLKYGIKEDSELYRVKRAKYRAKKYAAERSGIEFTIAFGEIDWPTHCPILGVELDYFAERVGPYCASFDRIDPNLGYVKGNVQIISNRANRLKSNASKDDIEKIYKHLCSLTCQE